ncbi:MAG: hypothetical protein KIT14_00200 [bacterium]|nr:hypothetical protein [bacterium]
MASGRRLLTALIGAATLLAGAGAGARSAAAAGACDAERAVLGLGLAIRGGTLVVGEVDAGSPASRAGFRVGDELLQVNATVPRSCAQWASTLEDARDERMAVLVLVRRGRIDQPLLLPHTLLSPPLEPAEPAEVASAPPATVPPPGVAPVPVPEPTTGSAPVPAPAPAGSAPAAVPVPPPVPEADRPGPPLDRPGAPVAAEAKPPAIATPAPLPFDVPVSLEAVVRGLADLGTAEDPPRDLTSHREAVDEVRRQIETLAVRQAAPADVVVELRRIGRYHAAAVVAWSAMQGDQDLDRRSRRLPVAEGATVDFFGDSPAAGIVDEYAFLEATVSRQPARGPMGLEQSGKWRPAWARILLWERAAQELEALRARTGT